MAALRHLVLLVFVLLAALFVPGVASARTAGPSVMSETRAAAEHRFDLGLRWGPGEIADSLLAAKGGVPLPPDLGKKISQKQLRHVKGRPEWTARGEGGYFQSVDEAQSVLDAVHSGGAQILGTTKQGHIVVEFKGVTGFNNNPRAGFVDQPTNVFIIKGTAKPSVVPTSPTWKPPTIP